MERAILLARIGEYFEPWAGSCIQLSKPGARPPRLGNSPARPSFAGWRPPGCRHSLPHRLVDLLTRINPRKTMDHHLARCDRDREPGITGDWIARQVHVPNDIRVRRGHPQ